ncbi:DUF4181 domain-containing protein [Halobacillus sp. MO56]
MENYGSPPGFWLDFLNVMALVIFMVIIIPSFLRRIMMADKQPWFSNSYLNPFHKKGAIGIRVVGFIALIILVILYPTQYTLFVVPFVINMTELGFRAYIEWDVSDNRSNYKVTLIEIFLSTVAISWVLWWLGNNVVSW